MYLVAVLRGGYFVAKDVEPLRSPAQSGPEICPVLYVTGISDKIHQGNALIVRSPLDAFFLRDTSANAIPPRLDRRLSGFLMETTSNADLTKTKAAS